MRVYFSYLLMVFLSHSAFAVENLEVCKSKTKIPIFTIAPGVLHIVEANEILVRGELIDLWETGFEDRTLYSISEKALLEAYDSPYEALFVPNTGAYLYILSPENKVVLEGYYKEIHGRNVLNYAGQDGKPRRYVSRPNMPQLYADRKFKRLVVNARDFIPYFSKGYSAVGILRAPGPEGLQRLRQAQARYDVHMADPERIVQLSEKVVYSKKVGDVVLDVIISKEPDQFYERNRKTETLEDALFKAEDDSRDPTLRPFRYFYLAADGRKFYGEKPRVVFAFDRENNLIFEGQMSGNLSDAVAAVDKLKAHRIVIAVNRPPAATN